MLQGGCGDSLRMAGSNQIQRPLHCRRQLISQQTRWLGLGRYRIEKSRVSLIRAKRTYIEKHT